MKVATWNLRHGRPQHGFTDNRALARASADLDADVIGVQEIDSHVIRSWFRSQPKLLARAVNAAVAYGPARPHFAVTGGDGVALLVRGQILREELLQLPRGAGCEPRVALIAEIRTTNGEVATVAVTHLETAPEIAMTQLTHLASVLANPDSGWANPRVLLGDLNLDKSDVDAVLVAAGFVVAGGAPTSPAWDPVRRIDHIAVIGASIRNVVVPPVPTSDHRPVTAELG